MTNIAMTCRDRFRLTEQAIQSLYANTPRDQFNLTVVNDGSTDFRIERLLEWAVLEHGASVLNVWNSRHILSDLKNLGVEWSRRRFMAHEWLCLCDNDLFFMPGWLDIMREAACATEPDYVLWSGQQHPYHHPISETDLVREYQALPGTHWFMRWKTWDWIEPIYASNVPGVCQGEDVTVSNFIREQGGKLGVPKTGCVIDCGLTNSEGKPQPGAELRTERMPGVYYE